MPQDTESTQGQQVEETPEAVVDQKFISFGQALVDGEIKANNAEQQAKQSDLDIAQATENAGKATWETAARTHQEYQTIRERVAIELVKTNEEMKSDLEAAKTVHADLDTNLDDTLTSVKAVHKKMIAVVDAVNNLEKVINDHCNKNEFKELNNQAGLQVKFNAIAKKAKEDAYAQVCKYFDTAVKVAGVEAQLNLDGLQTMADNITARITDFNADVDKNLKETATRAGDTRSEYDQAIRDRVAAKYARSEANNYGFAYSYLKVFSMESNKRRDIWTIDDVVEQVEKNFTDVIPPDDVDE